MEALVILAFAAMAVCLVLFCVVAVVLWRDIDDCPEALARRQERRDRRWSRHHRYLYEEWK